MAHVQQTRICMGCGMVIPVEYRVCPYCKHEVEVKGEEEKISKIDAGNFLTALVSGMSAGVVIGLAGSTLLLPYFMFGAYHKEIAFTTILLVVVVAPMVEEQAKVFGIYMLKFGQKINLNPYHWSVLGLAAGLGFGLLENALYLVGALITGGVPAALALLCLRTLLSLPLHLLATSTFAFGFGLWVLTRKVKYYIIFYLIAVLIHGLFNFSNIWMVS